MKLLILLVLFSFAFVDQSQASNVCHRIFGMFQRSSVPTLKISSYDALNASQQIDILLGGALKEIKRADPNRTHLPFYVPYIEYTISRLVISQGSQKSLELREATRELIEEAQYKIAQNRLNYFWVLDFSSRAVSLFDGRINHGFRNLEGMKKLFPSAIVLLTFAELDFSHFIRTENKDIMLIGMTENPRAIDGTPIRLSAEQFADHDYVHYVLNLKSEKVLSPWNLRHRKWVSLHQKIEAKLAQLPPSKRKYAEFIYFYALHESYGMRQAFVDGYLKKNLAATVRQKYRSQDIKDFFEGRAHVSLVKKSDLYQRMYRQDDFMDAFPNKNPQEVLLVGLESFIRIANEIDMGL